MDNNRKQKVNAFLDSITRVELEQYMKNTKLNRDARTLLNELSSQRPETHIERIYTQLNNDFAELLDKLRRLGQAHIIATVLNFMFDARYSLGDLKDMLYNYCKDDKILQEYVFEIMKDLE